MPVTTSTHTEAFDTGFRAWVTVTNDGEVPGAATITVDVQLLWDATLADYVGSDGGPAPTLLSAGLGLAVWSSQTLAVDASQDYGVLLTCADGVRSTVNVTGTAVDPTNKQRDSSSASWSCATGGASG
jgi:hypothetical protein